jgi:hypothetical protein
MGGPTGELAVLARMRQMQTDGVTCYGIAKKLNGEGIKPRYAEKWKPQTVFQILNAVTTI